jgi:hypothetical protein
LISLKKVLFSRKSSNNSLIFQSVFPHFGGFCSEIILGYDKEGSEDSSRVYLLRRGSAAKTEARGIPILGCTTGPVFFIKSV